MPEIEDRGIAVMRAAAANDYGGAEARVDTAVLALARLIGRRIAREELDRLDAANDNAPAEDAGERQETGRHGPALRPLRPLLVRPAARGLDRGPVPGLPRAHGARGLENRRRIQGFRHLRRQHDPASRHPGADWRMRVGACSRSWWRRRSTG